MRKLYQIVEISEKQNHAGSKARDDIAVIAEEIGFEPVAIAMDSFATGSLAKMKRQYGYLRDWKKAYSTIQEGSVLLLQHPFHYNQLTRSRTLCQLKQRKNLKIISFVHDVEELRGLRFNRYYENEFQIMLALADVIIVHNERMKEWFVGKGVSENKLICLGIFDYLSENGNGLPGFERSITVAGNLDITKSGYIKELGELKNTIVHLYGPNYQSESSKSDSSIIYHGSYPSEIIPKQLKSGFGLVWDGNTIKGCKGEAGRYLQFNNPHKLSLYIASGLPVVIWEYAAEADLVRDNEIGICVRDLLELDSLILTITEDDYNRYRKSVQRIRNQLQKGFYTRRALKKAMDLFM